MNYDIPSGVVFDHARAREKLPQDQLMVLHEAFIKLRDLVFGADFVPHCLPYPKQGICSQIEHFSAFAVRKLGAAPGNVLFGMMQRYFDKDGPRGWPECELYGGAPISHRSADVGDIYRKWTGEQLAARRRLIAHTIAAIESDLKEYEDEMQSRPA